MTTHSSILAWKITWTEEPNGLHSPLGHSQTRMFLCIIYIFRGFLIDKLMMYGTKQALKPLNSWVVQSKGC